MVNKKGCRLSSFHENLPNMQQTGQDGGPLRRQQTIMTSHAFPRRHADSAQLLRTMIPVRSDSTLVQNGHYDFRNRMGTNSATRDVVAKFADGRTGIIAKQFGPPSGAINIVGMQDNKKQIITNSGSKKPPDYSILPPLDCHAWVSQKNVANNDDADLTVVSCGLTHPSPSPTSKPQQQPGQTPPNFNNKITRHESLLQRHNRLTSRERTMALIDPYRRDYTAATFNLNRRKRTLITDKGDNLVHHSDTHLEITNSRSNNDASLTNLTKRLQISLPFYARNINKTTETPESKPIQEQSPETQNGGRASASKKSEHLADVNAYPIKRDDITIIDSQKTYIAKEPTVLQTDNKTIVADSQELNLNICQGSVKNTETHEHLPEIKPDKLNRQTTAQTWKSWHTYRDINDSYAYNDVKQYIQENDLMPPDKHKWMTAWLEEVNDALFSTSATQISDHGPV